MWWERVRAAEGVGPGVRWGHTCNSVQNGRHVYLFGGYGPGRCLTNDVHVFDSVTQTWNRPRISGNPPCPRNSHTCTTVGTNLFIFGGTDGKRPLSDLCILDTATNTWIQPTVHGARPDAREGHAAVRIDENIYYFGGCGISYDTHEEIYYNDLFMLDTDKMMWKQLVTNGTPPCSRDSHTCSSWNKKVIVICGEDSSDFYLSDVHMLDTAKNSWNKKVIVICGEDSSDFYLSDVHMLDTDTLAWEKINTKGDKIPPRAGHMTINLGNKLLVFGGFGYGRVLHDDLYLLNIEIQTWRKVTPVNQGPSPRFFVAGDCVDVQRGILVLFGGCNQSLEALDDLHYLHTDMPISRETTLAVQKKRSIKRELKRKWLTESTNSNKLEMRDTLDQQFAPETPQGFSHTGTKNGGGPTLSEGTTMFNAAVTGTNGGGPTLSEGISTMFNAAVTGVNQHGYTIETTINGQLLRGIVMSCTAGPVPTLLPLPADVSTRDPSVTGEVRSGTTRVVGMVPDEIRQMDPVYRPKFFTRPPPHLQMKRCNSGASRSNPKEPSQNQDVKMEQDNG